MTIAHIGSASPAHDVLALLKRRESEALRRLQAVPDGADDVSLLSATAAWNEARTATEAATALLSGPAGQREAA